MAKKSLHPRQMNADQLDALPELNTFGAPASSYLAAIENSDLVSWLGADGGYWQTDRLRDGTWCKRRIG